MLCICIVDVRVDWTFGIDLNARPLRSFPVEPLMKTLNAANERGALFLSRRLRFGEIPAGLMKKHAQRDMILEDVMRTSQILPMRLNKLKVNRSKC